MNRETKGRFDFEKWPPEYKTEQKIIHKCKYCNAIEEIKLPLKNHEWKHDFHNLEERFLQYIGSVNEALKTAFSTMGIFHRTEFREILKEELKRIHRELRENK